MSIWGGTLLPRGIIQSWLEAVDHGGALPPTWLNVNLADGPARRIALDFAIYRRQVVCEVAAVA